MQSLNLVQSTIYLTKNQKEFIRNSEYSLSKLVRITITKLMENNIEI